MTGPAPRHRATDPDPEPELDPEPGELDAPPGPAGDLPAVTEPPLVTPSPSPLSRRRAAVVSAAASLAFAALTVWVSRRGSAVPGDEQFHRWVLTHRGPVSAAIARDVRWAGVSWIVLPALIAVGAATAGRGASLNRRVRAGFLLCLVASTGVYAEIQVNALVGRSRPPMADWAGAAAGPSFPSGHTTAAALFAASCAWALAARVPAGWPRRAVCAGAALYAATVGCSRVWLGVHWPTDVIGGWLWGLAWLTGAIAVTITLRRPPAAPSPAAPPLEPAPEPHQERRS
jgi:undecaprenyl-diphosphatase